MVSVALHVLPESIRGEAPTLVGTDCAVVELGVESSGSLFELTGSREPDIGGSRRATELSQ